MLNSTQYSPSSVLPAEMPPVHESPHTPCVRLRTSSLPLLWHASFISLVTTRLTRAPVVRCPLLIGAGGRGFTIEPGSAMMSNAVITPSLNGTSHARIGTMAVATLPTRAPYEQLMKPSVCSLEPVKSNVIWSPRLVISHATRYSSSTWPLCSVHSSARYVPSATARMRSRPTCSASSNDSRVYSRNVSSPNSSMVPSNRRIPVLLLATRLRTSFQYKLGTRTLFNRIRRTHSTGSPRSNTLTPGGSRSASA